MERHINVIVFRRKDKGKPKSGRQKPSPYYIAQWRDPLTGKPKRKSTKTASKGEALTIAKKLETDLNAGRKSDYSTTWNEFRLRYENEVGRSKAAATQRATLYAFSMVEKHIKPKFLRSVTAAELSSMTGKLREAGLSEATIASNLRMLKAALRWAARIELIPKAPHITMPHAAARKAGGRAVTEEEFERMLAAVPAVLAGVNEDAPEGSPARIGRPVSEEAVAAWRFLLRGLWWSGLRLKEAVRLHWVDERYITVQMSGSRPLFAIQAEANKSRKTQTFPMALEFAEMLEMVPDDEREAFVFNPQSHTGHRCEFFKVSKTIAAIGRKAKVLVARDGKGNPVYASAHDLRRSFGTRWSRLVLPQTLKDLMRHTSIQTTMDFYITQSAEESADIAWKAAEAARKSREVAGSSASGPVASPAI